jgi:two-component system sensor histidine kinase YesM
VRFQTKLIYTYSFLIVLLVSILAVMFYGYSSGIFEREAIGTYELLGTKLGQQLDTMILPMDFISTNLISDASFKSALASLGSLDRQDAGNSRFITEAMQTISSQLSSYSIYKNFYAVVVFNRKGDFFSSNFRDHMAVSVAPGTIAGLPWIRRATEAAGRSVVVSPYEDAWRSKGKAEVYGRARVVPGIYDELGFIEVQNRAEVLRQILSVPGREFVRVLVFQADGRPFYLSEDLSESLVEYYRAESGRTDRRAVFRPNPITKGAEFITSSRSTYSDLTVTLALDKRALLAPLSFVRYSSLGLGLVIILFSMIYTWFSSRQLVKPLKLMQGRMEATELSNLPQGKPIDHPDDEIVALDAAFRSLTGRLDEAIQHELSSRTLWMQAKLDSLQAQVNPHFINNILTVIANRGLESGDEGIGQICQGVASMLRYSTSTEERSATIAGEIGHVETYLFLMKQRLEDRLDYHVEAAVAALAAPVPKIVFQQIVENSINHGYARLHKPMRIDIRIQAGGGRWLAELLDDGEGFQSARLEELKVTIGSIGEDLRAGTGDQGLALGGLGLINTYSRLFLFYHGDLLWEMGNRETGGAWVRIGGPLVAEAGESHLA